MEECVYSLESINLEGLRRSRKRDIKGMLKSCRKVVNGEKVVSRELEEFLYRETQTVICNRFKKEEY